MYQIPHNELVVDVGRHVEGRPPPLILGGPRRVRVGAQDEEHTFEVICPDRDMEQVLPCKRVNILPIRYKPTVPIGLKRRVRLPGDNSCGILKLPRK